jgi:hypothetical protein
MNLADGYIGIKDGPIECDCCSTVVDTLIRFRNADPIKPLYAYICFPCVKIANAVRIGFEGE